MRRQAGALGVLIAGLEGPLLEANRKPSAHPQNDVIDPKRICSEQLIACIRHHFKGRRRNYSITSAARASSVAGTVMPSAPAVLRFMIRSKRVGCSTGKSPGFAPLARARTPHLKDARAIRHKSTVSHVPGEQINRWPSVLQGEAGYLRRRSGSKRITKNIDCLRTPRACLLKCRFYFFDSARLYRDQFYTQPSRGLGKLQYLPLMYLVRWIDQYRNPGCGWCDRLEQL